MRQNIRRLVTSAKVFCLETSPRKYPYHFIVGDFASVIQGDCNKLCGLAYKVY